MGPVILILKVYRIKLRLSAFSICRSTGEKIKRKKLNTEREIEKSSFVTKKFGEKIGGADK